MPVYLNSLSSLTLKSGNSTVGGNQYEILDCLSTSCYPILASHLSQCFFNSVVVYFVVAILNNQFSDVMIFGYYGRVFQFKW